MVCVLSPWFNRYQKISEWREEERKKQAQVATITAFVSRWSKGYLNTCCDLNTLLEQFVN